MKAPFMETVNFTVDCVARKHPDYKALWLNCGIKKSSLIEFYSK